MRVALIGCGYSEIPVDGQPNDRYGGTERVISELHAAYRRLGHDPVLINEVHPLKYKRHWLFERHLRRLMKDQEFDAIHAHTMRAACALAMLGKPYFFTMHSPSWTGKSRYILPRIGFAVWERLAVRCADASIAMTETVQGIAEGLVMRRGPVALIPLGVDTEKFRAKGPGDPSVALCVGVMDRRKRWHMAAEALKGTGIHLRIVGPIRPEGIEYARDIERIDTTVEILGEVPESVLLQEYENAGMVIHPSSSEVFPGAAIQAASFSRPVIGGEAVSMIPNALFPSVPVREEEFLVPFIRNVALLLKNDEAKRRNIGERSRAMAEAGFTWDRIASMHISLYGAWLCMFCGKRHEGRCAT